MKGMTFGKDTGYTSPQKKAADATSALKKESDAKSTSWWKGQEGWIPDELQGGDKNVIVDGEKVNKEKYEKSQAKKKAIADKKAADKKEENRKAKPGEKVKGGTKTWKEGTEASKGNLNKWVAERKKHKKGSAEYNALQNKINKSLGSKKRHGVTTETKTTGPKVNKDTKRTTKTTKTTPGLGTAETKVVKGTDGTKRKKKIVEKDVSGDVTKKTKRKYDKDSKIEKKKKVTTYDKEKDTVTKTKYKGEQVIDGKLHYKEKKTKTRKKGGTGIVSAIKNRKKRKWEKIK